MSPRAVYTATLSLQRIREWVAKMNQNVRFTPKGGHQFRILSSAASRASTS